MLHWGSVLLKHLYNRDLKFKESMPRKGKTIIKRFFLGRVMKVLLGTNILFKKSLNTLVY